KYAFLYSDDIVGLHQVVQLGFADDVLPVLAHALDLDPALTATGRDTSGAHDRLHHRHARLNLVRVGRRDFSIYVDTLRDRHVQLIAALEALARQVATARWPLEVDRVTGHVAVGFAPAHEALVSPVRSQATGCSHQV